MTRKGFTLIEVLIVVSIIAVLASILIVAVMGTIDPAKVKTTDRRIKIIEDGLKRFIEKYSSRTNVPTDFSGKGYPRPGEFKNVSINGLGVDLLTGGEFLRLILYPSDKEIEEYLKEYGITEAVMTKDEVGELLNENEVELVEESRKIPPNFAFVDTWGFPFYYEFPGENHSDKGSNARKHQNWREEYGTNHVTAMNPKPDIWSSGANNVDDKKLWDTELNDPFTKTEDSENDDITNWFSNIQ